MTTEHSDVQLARIESKLDDVLVQNAREEERYVALAAKVQKHDDKLLEQGKRLHEVEIYTAELGTASGKDFDTFRGRWGMVWAVMLLIAGAVVSQIVRLVTK